MQHHILFAPNPFDPSFDLVDEWEPPTDPYEELDREFRRQEFLERYKEYRKSGYDPALDPGQEPA